MIQQHNRRQQTKAVVSAVVGALCCALSFAFFWFAPAWVAGNFGIKLIWPWRLLLAIGGLAAACVSGYNSWKTRGGGFSYHESGLYHQLEYIGGGAFTVDRLAHRVSVPAYVLSQVFMEGPMNLLKAWELWHSLIPESAELEARLEETLGALRKANKWQNLREYPSSKKEILYLAQMGFLDYSAFKGEPRFKIR